MIAISTHPSNHNVQRFGHGNHILFVEIVGDQLQVKGHVDGGGGCCGSFAKQVEGAEVLICTGLSQGAAGHLEKMGVGVVVVDDGTDLSDALVAFAEQRVRVGQFKPSACGHHDKHDGEGEDSCGGHGAHSCKCGNN